MTTLPRRDFLSASTPMDGRRGLLALAGLLCAPIVGLVVAGAPLMALGLVAALSVAVVLLGRPHWAAYAVCFGMFFSHTGLSLGVAFLDLGDLGSLALIPVWLLSRLANRERPRLMKGSWLIAAFLLWSFASLLFSNAPPGIYGRFARQFLMCLTCVALMDLLAEPGRLRIAFIVIAAAVGVEVLLAAPQFGSAYRVGGAYDQPNEFGNAAAIGAMALVCVWSGTRAHWVRAGLLAALGVVLLAVLLSISRGTYIALGVALLWWVHRDRRQVALILALGLVIGVTPSVRSASSRDIEQRLNMKDESVTHRWATLMNGLKAIEARPLLGVGFGQFTELDTQVEVTSQAGRSAHNLYLGIAATCGLPALLMYLGVVGGVVRGLWRWQRRHSDLPASLRRPESVNLVKGAQAMMVYLLVATLTKGVGPMLWCLMGVCAAASLLPLPRPTDNDGASIA